MSNPFDDSSTAMDEFLLDSIYPDGRLPDTIKVASFADLDDFVALSLGKSAKVASGEGVNHVLVHQAEQDLWSLTKEGDSFVIRRLFDDTGEPLKV